MRVRALDDRQLLYLDILIFAFDFEFALGLTVGELVVQTREKSKFDDPRGVTREQWMAFLDLIAGDSVLRDYRVHSFVQRDDLRAAVFCRNGVFNRDTTVIFRGTATAEGWDDNGEGVVAADTADQLQCLEFLEGLPRWMGASLTVSGHSKGGNRAQYLAIRSARVKRCLSVDGQGFSIAFLKKYQDLILHNEGRISHLCADGDPVCSILYRIGAAPQFVKTEKQPTPIHYHNPFILLDASGHVRETGEQLAFAKAAHEFFWQALQFEDAERDMFTDGVVAASKLGMQHVRGDENPLDIFKAFPPLVKVLTKKAKEKQTPEELEKQFHRQLHLQGILVGN